MCFVFYFCSYSFVVFVFFLFRSLGVILYVLLSGMQPFNDNALADQVKSGSYNFPLVKFGHISDAAKHLITCLLCVSPVKRYTIEQVRKHQWIMVTQTIINNKFVLELLTARARTRNRNRNRNRN
jgi:serine/threonine protein kinase